MRALLVVNPMATATSDRTRAVLVSALEHDLKLEVVPTSHRGHAAQLARQARLDGLDLVVVLGGDGTINEVVNGLLADGPHESAPALGVVPGGGANVLARILEVPLDPVEATGALLAAVRAGRTRTISLGVAGNRWFTFTASVGLDAEVVAAVDRRRQARGGERPPTTGNYVRAGIRQFFLSTDRRRPALTLYRPGAEPLSGLHLAIVSNTATWTYLGDRALVTSPQAGFDTGLDVYALSGLRTVGTLGEVRRLLTGRPSDRPRQVHRLHDLAEFTLRAVRPMATQVDGEYLGEVTELELRAVPAALRVVI